ncbi:MAG: biopolymer transporter ExbD, partial [Pseudomonadota bacterium]
DRPPCGASRHRPYPYPRAWIVMRPVAKTSRREPTIALINIVFLMLIFFLLAGVIAPAYELDVSPPSAQRSAAESRQGSTVYVSKDGQVSFQNGLMDIASLGAAVAQRPDGSPDNLRVAVDQETDGQLLIDVVAQLRGAGISRVNLVTRQDEP